MGSSNGRPGRGGSSSGRGGGVGLGPGSGFSGFSGIILLWARPVPRRAVIAELFNRLKAEQHRCESRKDSVRQGLIRRLAILAP
jgi:hypothetical protein